MTKGIIALLIAQGVFLLGFGLKKTDRTIGEMNFGVFSVSLAVKDIGASKAFYESLGFTALEGAGSIDDKWLIMEKDGVKIGLFEGMFPDNILTFNPSDAREIHGAVQKNGIPVIYSMGMEDASGPCSFSIADPDGNPILFDQFGE